MKIRIGFGPGIGASAGMGGEGFLRLVDDLERLGWDSIWVSERATGDVLDPLAAMAAVAGRTRRLKFGTSVLVLPGRNPVLLAKELATIDVLSGGRLVAAFGLGSPVPPEHEIFGVDRRERAARTDEATVLIRRLWLSDDVTHEGRFFTVRGLSLRPKPVQDDPTIDIWFGGHSEAACRRVGRIGDGWLPSFIAADEYKPRADLIRETAAANGREIEEEHYGALVPYIPRNAAEQADAILEVVKLRRPELDPRDVIVTGDDAAIRERLEAYVEQGASKFVLVPAVAPADWTAELERLYDSVVSPLEN